MSPPLEPEVLEAQAGVRGLEGLTAKAFEDMVMVFEPEAKDNCLFRGPIRRVWVVLPRSLAA